MLAAVIFAVGLAVVAVKDHRHTRDRLDRADVFVWYCAHRQQFCDRAKPKAIHDGWVTREYAYDAIEGVFAAVFVGAGIWLLRSRRAR
jgi:hypothetical protein